MKSKRYEKESLKELFSDPRAVALELLALGALYSWYTSQKRATASIAETDETGINYVRLNGANVEGVGRTGLKKGGFEVSGRARVDRLGRVFMKKDQQIDTTGDWRRVGPLRKGLASAIERLKSDASG